MRLHHLRVQAFGPFAGTESVDFDALSADGLFLLHGRTGAGKTSVLDAVCFALYGAVPGARSGGAPDLRSHHAAPDLPPLVELELTVAGRRLRVERSPAWQRAKRRGEGTTTEQARTLLTELDPSHPEADPDGWRPVSSRNDEAAQLLTDLLGMALPQFATVVLLPQGEFATFLRSGVTERRALLQRLFATDRYERAERWLAEERTRTATALERVAGQLSTVAVRAEQAAAEWTAPSDEPTAGGTASGTASGTAGGDAPAQSPSPEEVGARVAHLADLVRGAALDAEAARAGAAAAARTSAERLQAARESARSARRAHDLHQQHVLLERAEPDVAAQRSELTAALAAHGVTGHLSALDDATRALASADALAAAAGRALADLAGPDPGPGSRSDEPSGRPCDAPGSDLRARAAEHRREQGRLAELVALEADTAAREQQARAVAAEHERLSGELARVHERRQQQAPQRAAAQALLEQEGPVGAGASDAVTALVAAEAVLGRAREAEALTARCATASEEATSAERAAQDARSAWLDARQARLDGVAAELAAQLVPGGACPVCGACEHPAPAGAPLSAEEDHDHHGAASTGAAGAARGEEQAQQRWERADATARAARERLASLERDTAAAVGASGGRSVAEALALREEHDARVRTARAAVAAAAAARAQLTALEASQADDDAAAAALGEALARAGVQAEHLATGLTRDRARLEAARDGHEHLAARSDRLAALADAAEALASAGEAATTARRSWEAAQRSAGDAATTAGFEGLAQVRSAARSAEQRRALEHAVSTHERARTALAAQVAEVTGVTGEHDQDDQDDQDGGRGASEPVRMLERALVRLREAEDAHEQAEQAAEAALRATERATGAARLLERLEVEAADRARAAAPLASAAQLAGDLARCADGTGGGNARRMKLSTFVLAARLEQVAVVASERLEVMSDGRYRLEHTDALERRGAGSGLGLRVLDSWTGVSRDVATLSGGETFMASLALALGLADVVRAEGGGAPVETLFVDEGFGTLDPESLEEVMTVLEQLRAGGRAVGLVSHVPELRLRVPARLEVLRTATGSRLSTTTALADLTDLTDLTA